MAEVLVAERYLPVRRASRVVRGVLPASLPVRASRRDAAVIAVLTALVTRYGRWGFWKLFDWLRAQGHGCHRSIVCIARCWATSRRKR
ncbi:MAG: hypothetical protein IT177_25150 [Acidobacteria bacterium]|nr:hypothetical protein [Acidobacteriota bacterium]